MGEGLQTQEAAARFDVLRPLLTRVAYRMLGSRADAEDVVQDACLRWMGAERADIQSPEAYLRRVVTRLCLDQLKSARSRRETYLGPWLPEPWVQTEDEAVDDVTLPLLLALERLSPLERAAFLLHDVFDLDFDEVSQSIGRDPAACRQLASRARAHVREARPRFPVERSQGLKIAEAFFTASRSGDMTGLRAMLAGDVILHSDGGGKRSAALRVLEGIDEVMTVQTHLAHLFKDMPSRLIGFAFINGLPGFVTQEADGLPQTTALQVEGGKITAVYVMRNPDKLKGVDTAAHEASSPDEP